MINGWGFEDSVLQDFTSHLQHALPGITPLVISPLPPNPLPIGTWLNRLHDSLVAPAQAPVWLVGWSLGGQIAGLLAARYPNQIAGLITLCSNPCFVQRSGWQSAMSNTVFDAFVMGVDQHAEQTQQRFAGLCAQGSEQAKPLMRQLRSHLARHAASTRASLGLSWLGTLDSREALNTLMCPQLHLFAERDALVPVSAACAVHSNVPKSFVECVEHAGHALPVDMPVETVAQIKRFIMAQGCTCGI